ncbi:hypothetical protein B296_00007366 [Ensete ventricosum]|uniref:AMP-dependent synthetase/ligase domain-containing protein n=1 Tax=Ensete ventricosum TaxID=4639 RepID=A0A427B996_ENSVE|nr:hypothetical protein B296_00007366 [Ensete ventricosum]
MYFLQDVVPQFPTKCLVEWVDAEDPLFLLYTSGSTGKPKGVLHTNGGYMVYTATTFKYAFDYKPSDVYWYSSMYFCGYAYCRVPLCTADCGWITGHSYVTYGPLLNGATVLVFEGAPSYPDPGRCWDIVDKYKVTILYTAPTLVRALMRDGDELYVCSSDGFTMLSGIHDALYQIPGGKPRLVVSWCVDAPSFNTLQPVIVDEKGNEIEGECTGYLCIKKSWPGAFRSLYGDHERYETTYFKPFAGYYFTGDGCSR